MKSQAQQGYVVDFLIEDRLTICCRANSKNGAIVEPAPNVSTRQGYNGQILPLIVKIFVNRCFQFIHVG